jgi:UDP-glucose 4-epimerase
VFNVACGQTTNLTTLWNMIKEITKASSQANYGPNRNGDIMFSLADIENAKKILGYLPDADIKKQLESTIQEYKVNY